MENLNQKATSIPKRELLDHRSTSTSPFATKTGSNLPKNLEEYVDFSSPIVKHLIDIEKKFWQSKTNQNFKMPRAHGSNSCSSNESLLNVS